MVYALDLVAATTVSTDITCLVCLGDKLPNKPERQCQYFAPSPRLPFQPQNITNFADAE